MVIFQIQVADFWLCAVNAKRQTRVAGYAQAPRALSVADQGVRFPARKRMQFPGALHVIEKCQPLSELIRRVGGNPFRAILLVKPFQPFVGEAPYSHQTHCSLSPYTCQEH